MGWHGVSRRHISNNTVFIPRIIALMPPPPAQQQYRDQHGRPPSSSSAAAAASSSSSSSDNAYGIRPSASAAGSSSSSSITGHHIRRRVADQANQLTTRDYWSSVKANAKSRATAFTALDDNHKASSSQSTNTDNVYSTLAYTPRRKRLPIKRQDQQQRRLTTATVQDEVYPVLLPGYAFSRPSDISESGPTSAPELHVSLRGFVARTPSSQGRGQRMFNLMARQLARLPKPLSSSSTSALLNTHPSSTDDSHFFPGGPVPPPSNSSDTASSSIEASPQLRPLTERIAEEITDHVDDEMLGKLVEKVGALPIDGQRPETSSTDTTAVSSSASSVVSGPPPLSSSPVEEMPSRSISPTEPLQQPPQQQQQLQPPSSRLARLKAKGIAMSRSTSALLPTSDATSSATAQANAQLVGGSQFWVNRTLDEIHQLTANLNQRLADFWIFRVAGSRVRIDVQGRFDHGEWTTILAQELVTDGNGMFRLKVNLGPPAQTLSDLRARAVLLQSTAAPSDATDWIQLDLPLPSPEHTTTSSHSAPTIRLISDVDDTIRKTHVLQGLTAVFRQVFVLAHDEVAVKGMAEWYHSLCASPYKVGLHFVSNAPIELWRPIREFLHHAGMPTGHHLHLKSYNSEVEGGLSNTNDGANNNSSVAKTSLLSTWLQPASARKRAAILSILDDFPGGKFLLVGDTGELDLELYSELARERPDQIKALYLRNVSSDRDPLAELKEVNSAALARLAGKNANASASTSNNDAQGSRPAPPRRSSKLAPLKAPLRASTLDSSLNPGKRPNLLQRNSNNVQFTASSSGSTPEESLREAYTEDMFSPADVRPSQPSATMPPGAAQGSGSGSGSPSAFLARVLKAKNMIPSTTQLHFFKEGGDVREQSLALVEKLRAGC